MIINIRGTNGSGKTWVVQQLFTRYGQAPLRGRDGRISAHRLLGCNARVVGRYVKADGVTPLPTGGCDTVPTQDDIEALIRHHMRAGHVVLEGLLMSGLFSRWDTFARTVDDFRFVFLTTPLDECVKRTIKRREERGDARLFDPEKTLAPKYHAVERTYDKVIAAGHWAWRVSSDEAVPLICGWIEAISITPRDTIAVSVQPKYVQPNVTPSVSDTAQSYWSGDLIIPPIYSSKDRRDWPALADALVARLLDCPSVTHLDRALVALARDIAGLRLAYPSGWARVDDEVLNLREKFRCT